MEPVNGDLTLEEKLELAWAISNGESDERERVPWKKLFGKDVTMLRAYKEAYFDDFSRGEWIYDSAGYRFYVYVSASGLANEVLGEVPESSFGYISRLRKQDVVKLYREKFDGVYKTTLLNSEEGRFLLKRMDFFGISDDLLEGREQIDWSSMSKTKCRQYRRDYFRGMGRGEMTGTQEGAKFYKMCMRREKKEPGFSDYVLPKPILSGWGKKGKKESVA